MRLPHVPVTNNQGITQNFEHLQRLLTKGIQRGTSLPGSPTDGQEYDYVADATNGVIWRFRYRAASASTHKWEFVGGSPLFIFQENESFTGSEVFVEAGNPGPSITLPLAGDYEMGLSGIGRNNKAGSYAEAAIKLGTAAVGISEAMFGISPGAENEWYFGRSMVRTGLAAGAILKMYFRVGNGGECKVKFKELWARPVRVG